MLWPGRPGSAVGPLIDALRRTENPDQQTDEYLRGAAAEALGLIGKAAVGPLINVLRQTEAAGLCLDLAKALGQIDPAAEPAVEELIKALLRFSFPALRSNVGEALGHIGKAAFEELINALGRTEDPGLRLDATKALGASARRPIRRSKS